MMKIIGKGTVFFFFSLFFLGLFMEKTVFAKLRLDNEKTKKFYDEELKTEVWYPVYDIVDHTDGKKEILVKGVNSHKIVKNGNFLYYSKNKGIMGTVYRMDLRTKREKKIAKGKRFALMGGTKANLYIGEVTYEYGGEANRIFIFDRKSGKKKSELDLEIYQKDEITGKRVQMDAGIFKIDIKYGRLLTIAEKGDFSNSTMMLFDYSGKKLLKSKALMCGLYDGKVVYSAVYLDLPPDKDGFPQIRYFTLDLNGKNKKEITKKEFDSYR